MGVNRIRVEVFNQNGEIKDFACIDCGMRGKIGNHHRGCPQTMPEDNTYRGSDELLFKNLK